MFSLLFYSSVSRVVGFPAKAINHQASTFVFYLASLCFKESVYLEAPVYVNSETLEETGSEEKKPAVLYVPKCLCIVSRQRYFNTLKVRFY